MRVLITGGAGFIGCNTAHHSLQRGDDVTVFDNLSRTGSRHNLDWLLETGRASFVEGDVRDDATVRRVVAEVRPDAILHLAGQVAVTISIVDPRTDFEVNALGTHGSLRGSRLRNSAGELAAGAGHTPAACGPLLHYSIGF